MPFHNHIALRCLYIQRHRQRNSLYERHTPRFPNDRDAINGHLERIDTPAPLRYHGTQTYRYESRSTSAADDWIRRPTIDPRRWETERASQQGRDPKDVPVPTLEDRYEYEDEEREIREIWREKDFSYCTGNACAGPNAPNFHRAERRP